MEEELTQPCKDPSFIPSTYPPPASTPAFVFRSLTNDPDYEATQIVDEANRIPNGNSGLSDEDARDVVCILHPDNELTRIACSENHKLKPKNTISLEGDISNVAAQDPFPCDLAVRLSTDFQDLNLGWVFGRSVECCDFVLKDPIPKVSQQHFRIYLNDHCFLMVEDMSVNGIKIDNTQLRFKRKDDGMPHRHTLENGNLLIVTISANQDENFRFIVRIPQRNDEAQEAFDKNVDDYILRLQEDKIQRGIAVGEKRQPLNLFPNAANRGTSSSSIVGKRREWKGGSRYNKIDVIGRGAFAVVHRVTDKRTGVPFAAKELEKKRLLKNGVQKMDTEMKIMSKIHHDNVVRFIEYIDWYDHIYLIMEFVPKGDLTRLVTQCHHLPEPIVKTITLQLLSALKCLHNLSITHRDIKPDNILCESHDPIHVKLTDFGLSKMVDTEDTFLRTFCGTLLYCAPEVYNEYPQYDGTGQKSNRRHDSTIVKQYGHAVDIWSLAGVLFYSFCGAPPFPVGNTSHHAQLLKRIMTVPLDVRPLQHAGVSDYGISFVVKMLHTNPQHRATIEDLEQTPWLTGNKPDSDETEDEEDLALPASQLSLIDNPESEDEGDHSGADTIKFQPRQIPSSFSTNDSADEKSSELASSIPSNFGVNTSSAKNLVGQESHGLSRNPANNDNLLYGEVEKESDTLRSSGALPSKQFDFPTPIQHIGNNNPGQFAKQNGTHPVAEFKAHIEAASSMPKIPLPPPPPTHPRIVTPAMRHADNGVTQNPSSLMGAVSQLGHLQMNSSISPTEISASQLLSPTPSRAANASLRRRREDSDWYPNDLPPQKRHKSLRTIDFMVPPETFWDPRDPSTHHRNYPPMLASDYHRFVTLAESKGEKFQHGCTTFDHAMVSFRSFSKTPSMELNTSIRAQSEPLVEGAQNHPQLVRDERRLSDDASVQQSIASKDSVPITTNTCLPQVAQQSGPSSTVKTGTTKANAAVITTIETVAEGTSAIDREIVSAAGNDFQVPKRVLAKFSATPDSYVPTIAFNVTEPFTSWGRGYGNTIRYTTRDDVRVGVPRYAFKLLLFKNDVYPSDGKYAEGWNNDDYGFRFVISTKASAGLAINGIRLPSHKSDEPLSASKYWGEIRHGDIVTISVNSSLVLKLKFDCFWGMGKYRRLDSNFFLYKELDHIAKIDQICTNLEAAAIEKRNKDQIEQQKLAKEIKRQRTESVGL
ncbi:Protein kinase protein rad53 [Ciborinia camelliae]|nr:Protein kinase protein rad53 [Ciborinia camelliae]